MLGGEFVQAIFEFVMLVGEVVKLLVRLQQLLLEVCDCSFMLRLLRTMVTVAYAAKRTTRLRAFQATYHTGAGRSGASSPVSPSRHSTSASSTGFV